MHTSLVRILVPVLVSASFPLAAVLAAGGDGPDAARLSSSYNDLGISLHNLVAAENKGGNIFISPLSISIALAMTHGGAAGGTADEIARTLRLEGWDRKEIAAANEDLLARLGAEIRGVTLEIANSLWPRDGLDLDPLFLRRTSARFGAEVRSLDFSSPGAADAINEWVSAHTEGMIDEIVRETDPLSILYIINAVYFKGEWKEEFDEASTAGEDFHLDSGGVRRVEMMHQSGSYRYDSGEDYQAVSLPYGDGRMSMYLFLPDSSSSLEAFHARLEKTGWKECMRGFSKRSGSIALPRFRAEFETGLEKLLERLGMVKAFDPQEADFSGMTGGGPEQVWIDEILHKAVIEVTEKGTEAAAATSVVMVASSISVAEPFVMIFDRPFFFAIRDDETGMILFTGSIADPERPERAW